MAQNIEGKLQGNTLNINVTTGGKTNKSDGAVKQLSQVPQQALKGNAKLNTKAVTNQKKGSQKVSDAVETNLLKSIHQQLKSLNSNVLKITTKSNTDDSKKSDAINNSQKDQNIFNQQFKKSLRDAYVNIIDDASFKVKFKTLLESSLSDLSSSNQEQANSSKDNVENTIDQSSYTMNDSEKAVDYTESLNNFSSTIKQTNEAIKAAVGAINSGASEKTYDQIDKKYDENTQTAKQTNINALNQNTNDSQINSANELLKNTIALNQKAMSISVNQTNAIDNAAYNFSNNQAVATQKDTQSALMQKASQKNDQQFQNVQNNIQESLQSSEQFKDNMTETLQSIDQNIQKLVEKGQQRSEKFKEKQGKAQQKKNLFKRLTNSISSKFSRSSKKQEQPTNKTKISGLGSNNLTLKNNQTNTTKIKSGAILATPSSPFQKSSDEKQKQVAKSNPIALLKSQRTVSSKDSLTPVRGLVQNDKKLGMNQSKSQKTLLNDKKIGAGVAQIMKMSAIMAAFYGIYKKMSKQQADRQLYKLRFGQDKQADKLENKFSFFLSGGDKETKEQKKQKQDSGSIWGFLLSAGFSLLTNFLGGLFRSAMGGIWKGVKWAGKGLWRGAKWAGKGLMKGFKAAGKFIDKLAGGAFTKIGKFASNAFGKISGGIGKAFSKVSGLFKGKFFQGIGKAAKGIGKVFKGIGSAVKGGIKGISKAVKFAKKGIGILKAPGKFLGGSISKIAGKIGGKLGGKVLGKVAGKGALKMAGRLAGGALKAVPGLGWGITAAMAVVDGVQGWKNAGSITGKKQKDLTWKDRTAAAGASVLSGLTFGLVSAKTMYKGMGAIGNFAKKAFKFSPTGLAFSGAKKLFGWFSGKKKTPKKDAKVDQNKLAAVKKAKQKSINDADKDRKKLTALKLKSLEGKKLLSSKGSSLANIGKKLFGYTPAGVIFNALKKNNLLSKQGISKGVKTGLSFGKKLLGKSGSLAKKMLMINRNFRFKNRFINWKKIINDESNAEYNEIGKNCIFKGIKFKIC